MGEGTESALRLYFHLRKTGRISPKIHILHQIISFFTLTRIEIVKKKLYLLPNPGSKIPETFLGRTAYSNQNLKYCIGGSCSKADQFVSLAGTSLPSL